MDYDMNEGSGHPIERDLELVGNKTVYVLSGSKVIYILLQLVNSYSKLSTYLSSPCNCFTFSINNLIKVAIFLDLEMTNEYQRDCINANSTALDKICYVKFVASHFCVQILQRIHSIAIWSFMHNKSDNIW